MRRAAARLFAPRGAWRAAFTRRAEWTFAESGGAWLGCSYAFQVPVRSPALLLVLLVSGCSSQGAASAPADATVPAVLRCASSLSSWCDLDAAGVDCPPAFASQLPSAWCAANPRAGALLGSCDGYAPLVVGTGTDGILLFMYPADGGALAAVLGSGDLRLPQCLGGAPSFALPVACFSDEGADLLMAFTGPGALPCCATFDAGQAAALDGGDGGDGTRD